MPPDDSTEAARYQGPPGQGSPVASLGPWLLLSTRRGLSPVTGMSQMCHFFFIQEMPPGRLLCAGPC